MIEELLAKDKDAGGGLACHEIKAVRGRLLVGSWLANQNMQDVVLGSKPNNLWATLVLTDEKSTNPGSSGTNIAAELVEISVASDGPIPPPIPSVLRVPGYHPKQHPTQFLARTLPASLAFIHSHLASSPDSNVTITCKDGKDLSVGIATAALTLYFDDSGEFRGEPTASGSTAATKDSIKRRLQWVLSACPSANPARATLRRINEYLMSPNRPSLPSRSV